MRSYKDGLSSVASTSPWSVVAVSPARWSCDAVAVTLLSGSRASPNPPRSTPSLRTAVGYAGRIRSMSQAAPAASRNRSR
jgi:hypothetical protein